MNWTRVKTIVIILLIIVNVFLAMNLYNQYKAKNYLDEEMLYDTAELLSAAGIKVEPNILPRNAVTAELLEGDFGNDYHEYVVSTITGTDNFSWHMINNGIKCNIKDSSETFEFYDNDNFSIKYTRNGDNESGAEYSFEQMNSGSVEAGAARTGRAYRILKSFLFSKLDNSVAEYDLKVEKSYYDSENNICYLECTQLIEGRTVGELSIDAVIKGSSVVYVEGTLVYLFNVRKFNTSLYDQVNILMLEKNYLERISEQNETAVDCEISDISCEYCINWNSERSKFYLLPAWKIEYTDKTVHIRNAVNGSIYIN